MTIAVLAAFGAAALLAHAADAHRAPGHGSHVVFGKARRHAGDDRRGTARRRRTRGPGASTVHRDILPGNSGCTGLLCDFQDPDAVGCDAGAETVGEAPITDSQGNQLGYVELRWSSRCQTSWARVTSTAGAIFAPA